jgi:hypothetical protein
MGRSVTITTPIPTLEEVGKRLNMSKARQQRLIEIVRGSRNGQLSERRRNVSGSLFESKKSKRASTR